MAWAPAFIDALQAPRVALRFAVETFGTALGEGVGVWPVVYSTHKVPGAVAVLEHDSIRVGSHSVSLDSWTYRRQSWSFALAAPINLRQTASILRPGTLVRLRCDATNQPYGAAWEVIQTGVVAGLRWSAGRVEVQVYDLLTGLRQRITQDATKLSLFPKAGNSSTIASSSYTAGDSTMTLASATGFDDTSGGSIPNLCRVTPSGGSAFFLEYTAISGAVLSGLSSTGKRGTTAVNASIGDTVEHIAYHDARPDLILARTLTSTGTLLGNGTYDVHLEEWGYALDWSTTIDTSDMVATWGNTILGTVSGGWDVSLIAEEPVTDGLTFLGGFLSALAIWPVNRQGLISIRTPQDPTTAAILSGATIADADIVGTPEVEWYHPDRRSQATRVRVVSTGGASTGTGTLGTVGSLPAARNREYDVSAYLFDNEANVRTDLADRTRMWDTAIPEHLRMTLRGCGWARLVPGDIVRLDLPGAADRYNLRGRLASTVDGYNGRRGMVTEVAPDWIRGTTTIAVAVAPRDAADDLL